MLTFMMLLKMAQRARRRAALRCYSHAARARAVRARAISGYAARKVRGALPRDIERICHVFAFSFFATMLHAMSLLLIVSCLFLPPCCCCRHDFDIFRLFSLPMPLSYDIVYAMFVLLLSM